MKHLNVGYSALTDALMNAARSHAAEPVPADDLDQIVVYKEERDATLRAVAVMVAGGYCVGEYRDVFYSMREQIEAGVPAGTIAIGLLNQFGH